MKILIAFRPCAKHLLGAAFFKVYNHHQSMSTPGTSLVTAAYTNLFDRSLQHVLRNQWVHRLSGLRSKQVVQ